MGLPMAMHVCDKYDGLERLHVYSRTAAKVEPLLQRCPQRVQWHDSARQVAEHCEMLVCMVGYPQDVEEVMLHPETGVLAAASGDRTTPVIIDCTTSDPNLAERLAEAAAQRGSIAYDAPVTGGDVGARAGTLSVLVGCDTRRGERERAVRARVERLLQCFAGRVTFFEGVGSGQRAKLANQIDIASTMVGMAEALVYAHRVGLPLAAWLDAVSQGAAASFSLNVLGKRAGLERDFAPGFYVEHFVKDLGIALNEAQRLRLCLPGLALAQQLYLSLMAHGDGRKGTQALLLALERMNGLDGANATEVGNMSAPEREERP